MAQLLPADFLVRMAIPCQYTPMKALSSQGFRLTDQHRLNCFPAIGNNRDFADIRIGWNEFGFGVQVRVEGKRMNIVGDKARPRSSDGLSLWLDTREDRTSHRAGRFCHQFHFLPKDTVSEEEGPAFVQSKINRALQDSPLANQSQIQFRADIFKDGYLLEAFLPGDVLSGFDPEQFPRWGIYTAVRDLEKGDQYLTVNQDFPFSDDPSLWQVLELVK